LPTVLPQKKKLDFEKAFDKVEHDFILQVLHAKGFGSKWSPRIKQILASATSYFAKWCPWFHVPLPPLFVLDTDFLQTLVNEAMSQGHLTRPFP
jgi:hypothetical protein